MGKVFYFDFLYFNVYSRGAGGKRTEVDAVHYVHRRITRADREKEPRSTLVLTALPQSRSI